MLAKRFFYASAAILCLALAYHFGAANATAQASQLFRVLHPSNPLLIETGGLLYYFDTNVSVWRYVPNPPPVPASSVLVGDTATYMTEDGTTWVWGAGSGQWGSVPLPGTPTPAQRETFGAMKSRYSGERGAAQPTPQDR